MTTITEAEIEDRLASIVDRATERETEKTESLSLAAARNKYIRPLSAAADSVLEALENSDDRFRLGLAEIDVLTRGFGAKELIVVTGFSHAGKTQLINTAILNNAHKRVLFFSMDDPAEMILLKLACMHEGISAEVLETRVRQQDASAKLMLRQAASHTYGNLFVVDDCLSIAQMSLAIGEATAMWGERPDAIIIDYLDSIVGNSEGPDSATKAKAAELKRWVKGNDFPTVVIHQQSRSKGGPGQAVTITSGAHGGEQEATILIGVRRKRDDEDLDPSERQSHANTITIHVVKNKRPPARITPPQGHDFNMDPDTGLIKSISATALQLSRAVARENAHD